MHVLMTHLLERISAEKAFGVLADSKLSQQCAPRGKKKKKKKVSWWKSTDPQALQNTLLGFIK